MLFAKQKLTVTLLSCVVMFGCATPVAFQPVKNAIPPAPAGVYDISEVNSIPVAVSQVEPVYPAEMKEHDVNGEAMILFTVLIDGTVSEAMVVTANDVQFGHAALNSVRQWRFQPALVNGKPVNCRLMVPISFDIYFDRRPRIGL
jgi:TonB family protein